ncbi:GGDEF domain-containing protein [Terracidiphilus gabretensis]|uniref:GGDEF domain-containing protein n=1 Tax=Terracidiphilus gabretensis TaxID=1577687 RepID=UPI00071BF7B5|nr:GGDEF domain-containing protein [Terracidiphilus gabretensis]
MPPCGFPLRRIAAIALLAFACHWLHAEQAGAKSPPVAPVVIDGLGKGTFPLSGPWQFHPGDDPAWANPAFDSSAWEQLTANQSWGAQGHVRLTGFAWYRCYIAFTPAPGVPPRFSLLVPRIDDAYEIYWNGSLIGRNGKLPPRAVWYTSQPEQTFGLDPVQHSQVQHGLLAVRVWKAPLLSDDSGENGGFEAAPLMGSSEAIATARAAHEFQWLRSRQLHFGANLLCAVIALLSFLLWLRAPARWILFWTAGFALAQPATVLLLNAHMGWRYGLAMGADQLVGAVQDISLWFLLLWLLPLRENHAICRLTRTLACVYFVNSVLDGILVVLTWNPQWTGFAQTSDAISTAISVALEAFPLFLVGYAFFHRRHFNPARWLVAILAFLDGMMIVFVNVVKQGRQFTAWPIASRIDSPLFFIDDNGISLSTLAGSLLLIAIVYAVYNSIREDQRRQDALELEKLELLHESNRMRHQAEHDGLTGLWNHRAIVDRLGEEISRSTRDKTPLSVILVDVDHFKKINDTFGHLAGDLVLKEIGAIFTHYLRPYDYAGRYGGEEFLILLSNCGMENALHRAEQLRQAVESARVVDGETILQVTASFGVTSAFSSHYETETVIRTIDAALYQAKKSGRNCIVPIEMNTPLHRS